MSTQHNENVLSARKAGFWDRLLAGWVDFLLIYALVKLFFLFQVGLKTHFYFPFEFTVFILFVLYSAKSIALRGRTIGKWLLGLRIKSIHDERLPVLKSIIRETLAKFISLAFLCFGFLWIGFTKKKKGWHDLIVGSIVEKEPGNQRRVRLVSCLAIISLILVIGRPIVQDAELSFHARKMEIAKQTNFPYRTRPLSAVRDITKIGQDSSFLNWVNLNALDPGDFAVKTASSHQLTIFGEFHENKDNLDFLNRVIPALYYKGGVRCIAMEVIPSSMNSKVERLVNAPGFDRNLQLEIARKGPYTIWGFKEYWDVLETVWKLNRNLPAGEQKMRLIGIDIYANLSDVALTFAGKDDAVENVPFYERFRFITAIKELPKAIYRDGIMAYNIKNEILDRGIRGIVWIGDNHAKLNFGNRFGAMLKQQYGNEITQVAMWHTTRDFSRNPNKASAFDELFERTMAARKNQPAGFSIAGSPFGNLYDSSSEVFDRYPTLCMGDLMENVIFLKPFAQAVHSTWMNNYLTETSFLENKPFYKLKFNKGLKYNSAKELNELFSSAWNDGKNKN